MLQDMIVWFQRGLNIGAAAVGLEVMLAFGFLLLLLLGSALGIITHKNKGE